MAMKENKPQRKESEDEGIYSSGSGITGVLDTTTPQSPELDVHRVPAAK